MSQVQVTQSAVLLYMTVNTAGITCSHPPRKQPMSTMLIAAQLKCVQGNHFRNCLAALLGSISILQVFKGLYRFSVVELLRADIFYDYVIQV